MSPLLSVRNLRVSFPTRSGMFEAVRGVSFDLGRERLGVVGESGSGKSMTGRAILGLVRPPGRVEAERMELGGESILNLPEARMRRLRGSRISMVMQDPKFSLNPVMTVGRQIMEGYRLHTGKSRAAARDKALEMLAAVQIRDPERVFHAYPHEVSGGMGQRIMIAMMLAPDPEILIADEPTSALDVSVRNEVLRIMDRLVGARGMGLIFISHDLNLVAQFCDRVLIMYAGRVVEELPARDLHAAKHPYTQGLLNSLPRLDRPVERLAVLQRQEGWRDALPAETP
ncbi:ABC transporter ATP-binding protein [Paracoccus denitrificans]|jgi:peptide/nickel transport system ATP-binding protein|uniref:ABC transporter related protein n=1 Tax=Paracoccus denitrificans (strain Pd 1222) TaxID=318586 RepID=A1B1G2_PARDP|nr:ABC transporter ATP-binding protein [Paracoccus denitrificans]ABL69356.1 ABC transporter related protein [Paracoccus denitrificans PD1222]MBB4629182.1 peptide/nickel transport system ATP-binding protein [Paracoccus denitrificans]MCU7430139.1 ABC transporter ATP-binding protein [Paracoccus denitrificans]QAR27348.1 ABC transporter ATP-binding protein [Paracoccus denitrificans]UPV96323.1 ABC transporter ATP-binding protein [Paracoccus denitrificans]